jgi:hypothetical protein
MKNLVYKTLIARKLHKGIAYRIKVDQLKDITVKVTLNYRDNPALVYAIIKHFFLYQL